MFLIQDMGTREILDRKIRDGGEGVGDRQDSLNAAWNLLEILQDVAHAVPFSLVEYTH